MSTIPQQIVLGAHDSDLDSIVQAVNLRRKTLAQAGAMALRRGDVVRFASTIRPKYLAGLRATVEKVNKTTVQVKVVDEDRLSAERFGYGPFRCPVTLIDLAEPTS